MKSNILGTKNSQNQIKTQLIYLNLLDETKIYSLGEAVVDLEFEEELACDSELVK